MRTFEARAAVRERVPLLIGLVGCSGSGKTFSALRLGAGIGGEMFVIDTEARRSLWYAEKFKFQHVDFRAPFGSLDYLAAIEHCVGQGAKTIVIDSMSHEHEGPGGVLETHDKEQERLAAQWKMTRDKVNMSAWQKPKADRRHLLNAMLQMPVNFILCFRAKEKVSLAGEKPKPLGWMPIAGEEFVYEMTVNCLLYPNAGGVPSWHPDEMGEKAIIKLPGQFRDVFATKAPLSEDIGRKLAEWAAGGAGEAPAAQATAAASPRPAAQEAPDDADCAALCRVIRATPADKMGALGKQYWPKGQYIRPWTSEQKRRIVAASKGLPDPTLPVDQEDRGDAPSAQELEDRDHE